MIRYPIYGGPLAGNRAEEAATVYAYRENVVAELQSAYSEGRETPRYTYDLTGTKDGKAFLLRNGKDLVAAYRRTGPAPARSEADGLLAQIERRNLNI
ncbi:MAG: hypothetical protein EOO77_14530 [Oxalobacteraceae bacterium]|nr:MAG: hypothetical protein EOO77_14530 [Oxalobacteraceae bacterium]